MGAGAVNNWTLWSIIVWQVVITFGLISDGARIMKLTKTAHKHPMTTQQAQEWSEQLVGKYFDELYAKLEEKP
jgi:hypothetical protein